MVTLKSALHGPQLRLTKGQPNADELTAIRRSVYVVQHSYERDDADETKFIGVFASWKSARAAVDQLVKQPGFDRFPDDFWISRYELDEMHWTEGFVTIPHETDDPEGE